MAELYLLRHYPTDWNIAQRIQGKTDIPLSTDSLNRLEKINLPAKWKGYQWFSSPLLRTRQTAEALDIRELRVENALAEMNWGEFEGLTLSEIEQQIAVQNIKPGTGLHFRPPQGETPAEVRTRFETWLETLKGPATVAVTHKGVIRAALSLATGWDMETPIHRFNHEQLTQRINWLLPIKFSYGSNRALTLVETNVAVW